MLPISVHFRGHNVTLYEKEKKLEAGNMRLVASILQERMYQWHDLRVHQ